MPIPSNITKEDLVKAIKRIDSKGIPPDGQSKQYDIIYEGKTYPPKLVVSYANVYANGVELNRNSFEGGKDTACFRLLRKHGFIIEPKDVTDFYPILLDFLEQANSALVSLKVDSYPKSFKGLKLKVSFGQGAVAGIPWIAFLRENQTVSKGIYPVYLYFREYRLLILSYGVSETNGPDDNWTVSAKTVLDVLQGEYFKEVRRYGNSLVYAAYEIDVEDEQFGLKENVINKDLSKLIDVYKALKLKGSLMTQTKEISAAFNYNEFKSATDIANLKFDEQLILRFIASLCTKPFVILTGLAGSGKTKLAQAFIQWIVHDESQYRIVPVGADWTNRDPLLGYPNALKPEEYVEPDSGVLDLIIQANNHPELPHFLLLDEMNLSHVERYFADFLSVMESKKDIPLHKLDNVANAIPQKLCVPSNLFIIGTVNIDETTNMFSPKVLDRANTIEFRVTEKEMKDFLQTIQQVSIDTLNAKGVNMAQSFLQLSENKSIVSTDTEEINQTLMRFFVELKKGGAEFGYRTATEILGLINQLTVLNNILSINDKLDIAIMQKLLPKLHGSRRKLCPILITLGSFCVRKDMKMEKDVFDKDDFDFDGEDVKYSLSLEKIARMYKGAIDNGFASFAEA